MPKEANYKLENIKELKLNIANLNKKINMLHNNIKQISSNVYSLSNTITNTLSTKSNFSSSLNKSANFLNSNKPNVDILQKIKSVILNHKTIHIRLLFNNDTYYTVKVLGSTHDFVIVQTKEVYNINDNSYNLIVIIPISFSEKNNFINENTYNNINKKLNSNRNNIHIDIKTNLLDIDALKKDYFHPIGMYLNEKYYINGDIEINYHLPTLFKIYGINITLIKGFANTESRKENKCIRNVNDHKHFINLIKNSLN